jgi:hypothetical protein
MIKASSIICLVCLAAASLQNVRAELKPYNLEQVVSEPIEFSNESLDLASLLGADIWKFRVKAPPHLSHYTVALELYRDGKLAESLAEFRNGMGGNGDSWKTNILLVSISPVVTQSAAGYDAELFVFRFGKNAKTFKNPFKEGGTIINTFAPERIDSTTYALFDHGDTKSKLCLRIYAKDSEGRYLTDEETVKKPKSK